MAYIFRNCLPDDIIQKGGPLYEFIKDIVMASQHNKKVNLINKELHSIMIENINNELFEIHGLINKYLWLKENMGEEEDCCILDVSEDIDLYHDLIVQIGDWFDMNQLFIDYVLMNQKIMEAKGINFKIIDDVVSFKTKYVMNVDIHDI